MKWQLAEGSPSSKPLPNPDVSLSSQQCKKQLIQSINPLTTTRPQEIVEESRLNQSFYTTGTLEIARRHPFTNYFMGAQLPPMWKGLNIDRYNRMTDLNEHMDVYTTQMSLYTSDNVVLCRVFHTSLKGGALSWFT